MDGQFRGPSFFGGASGLQEHAMSRFLTPWEPSPALVGGIRSLLTAVGQYFFLPVPALNTLRPSFFNESCCLNFC